MAREAKVISVIKVKHSARKRGLATTVKVASSAGQGGTRAIRRSSRRPRDPRKPMVSTAILRVVRENPKAQLKRSPTRRWTSKDGPPGAPGGPQPVTMIFPVDRKASRLLTKAQSSFTINSPKGLITRIMMVQTTRRANQGNQFFITGLGVSIVA